MAQACPRRCNALGRPGRAPAPSSAMSGTPSGLAIPERPFTSPTASRAAETFHCRNSWTAAAGPGPMSAEHMNTRQHDGEPRREDVGGAGRGRGRSHERANELRPDPPNPSRDRGASPARSFGLALVEQRLERDADPLGQHRRRLRRVVARSHDPDGVVAAHPAVAPEMALLLVQRPQPLELAMSHGPDDSRCLGCVRGRTREVVRLRGRAGQALGRPVGSRRRRARRRRRVVVDAETPPSPARLASAHVEPTSLRSRGGQAYGGAAARGTVTRRGEEDRRFAFVDVTFEAMPFEPKPRRRVGRGAAGEGERDCFVGGLADRRADVSLAGDVTDAAEATSPARNAPRRRGRAGPLLGARPAARLLRRSGRYAMPRRGDRRDLCLSAEVERQCRCAVRASQPHR